MHGHLNVKCLLFFQGILPFNKSMKAASNRKLIIFFHVMKEYLITNNTKLLQPKYTNVTISVTLFYITLRTHYYFLC